jgi:hypothetical protein
VTLLHEFQGKFPQGLPQYLVEPGSLPDNIRQVRNKADDLREQHFTFCRPLFDLPHMWMCLKIDNVRSQNQTKGWPISHNLWGEISSRATLVMKGDVRRWNWTGIREPAPTIKIPMYARRAWPDGLPDQVNTNPT